MAKSLLPFRVLETHARQGGTLPCLIRRSIDEGYCDFASSRAYYAIFYVMQAALLTKEMAYRKERAVIRAFNRDFVRIGIFPKEFGNMVARLYRQRWIADEQYERRIGKAEAKADLKEAEEIAGAIMDYLIKEDFIESGYVSG